MTHSSHTALSLALSRAVLAASASAQRPPGDALRPAGPAHRRRAARHQGRAGAAALRPDDARPARSRCCARKLTAKGAKVETLNYGPAPDLQARLDEHRHLHLAAGRRRTRRHRPISARSSRSGSTTARDARFTSTGTAARVIADGRAGDALGGLRQGLRRRARHRLRQAARRDQDKVIAQAAHRARCA